ncbi:hypothetical protein DDZ13_06390 [Coraliomargarita sinensis]|uniref:Transporter n=1 Tax=Coraliomargarita sinensis TaxID=2174842 RepID=A0A317ZN05_9BACT|nr:transporter [Coraliomargarita sinensis]PXA04791.1 hypothetical protein DDZ13_06390 [Coraliomargarita sinensis]
MQLTRTIQYLGLLILSLCALVTVGAEQFKISSGVDYSSGDYGSDVDTEILFVPLTLSYANNPWKAKVTIPWIQIKGPGNVVGGGDGGVIIGDGGTRTTTESGLGDIWTSLSYSVEEIPAEWFYLDLVGKVKIPTADEDRGLGTGEFDYTLQLDFFKPLGQLTPIATVAYKIKGDPDDYELDNVFYISVGADYRLNDKTNIGATLDFQEASSDSSEDSVEIFSYLSHSLNEDWKLTGYTYFGLTDGSPDAGGGLSLSYSL